MESNKFIINNICPVYLKFYTNSDACELVCMIHQDLGEKYAFTSTHISFNQPSKIKAGKIINLVGKDIDNVLQKRHTENSYKCSFVVREDLGEKSPYYYAYKGDCFDGNRSIRFLIPRYNYIRIKYMIEIIKLNGGFPKSAAFIFNHDKMTFIKVDSLSLEGSRVKAVYQDREGYFSEIESVFILKCGAKEYHIKDIITVQEDINIPVRLHTPAPDFLFDKVYTDDHAVRIGEYGSEIMFLIFDIDNQGTTVFIISNKEDMDKLTKNYIIK